MKTDTLKKSLLDYAIKGSLTAKFRRENAGLNAFDELEIYNDEIKQKRKDLEKKLKKCEKEFKLEKDKDKKALFKSQIQSLKKELTKCKEITPLFCHTEPLGEVSNNTESTTSIIAKRKGVYPLPAPLNPEKNKATAVSKEASLSFRQSRGEPRLSASSTQAEAGHYCPPFSAFAHHEAGESEAPFTIPNSWAWVKLGDICEMKKGPFGSAITKDMFIPNGSNAVKIYEQKNAIQKSETLGEYYISLEHFEKLKQFEVFENDIIVSCAGTIGEIFRIPKNAPKGIINQALMKIKLVNEEWIPYFMIFFDFLIKQKSQENSKGSAIKNIPPLDILKNFTIPLPPLCEQQEIVKKLDLLVSLANDFAITKENLKRIEKRIEKSLLKLALEGSLSKLYRRSSSTLSAFDEINTYNEAIKEKRKDLEKELKTLESTLKKVEKKDFSPTAQNDKQKTTQSKASLENDKNATCHTEPLGEVSKTTESQLVIFSECEKSTKEIKQNLKSQIQSLKKEIVKCKEITPLFCHTTSPCHTEPLGEVSNNTESTTSIIAKRKGVYPLPAPLNPEKNKVAAFSFRQSRGEPRCSSSHTQAEAGHYCPPFSAFAHHEAGESEAPFEIPNSWAWVKLGDICEINPKNDISDNVEISFIPMALIADSCQNTFTYELKLWKEVKGGFTHLCDNSVAFAKISPCFENGKSFVVKNLKNGYGAGTTELIVLLPYNPLLKEYVFYCVNSAFFVNQALKTFKGTAGQQRLNMDFVENFTIPLPPLKEQEHIAQTLDTLFTLKKGLRVE